MTDTEKFLRMIVPPDFETSLRIMLTDEKNTVLVGRYNNLTVMANVALDIDRDAETWPELGAVYFLSNPLDPAKAKFIGDRSTNTLRSGGRSGGDRDIAGRYVYLVDTEANRPAGTCSTDEEKAQAYAVTQALRNYAAELGLPEPITVDSGNGYHLYFRGDGANAMSDIWPFMLKHFDDKLGSLDVKVDTAVGNASRVMRLPGTLNRKGENTPERPHRRCKVVAYPAEWIAITSGQLLKIAASLGYKTPEERTAAAPRSDSPRQLVDDIEDVILEFIAAFPEHLEFTHRFMKNGQPFFALRECPFVGRAHNGHNRKTAIKLGPDYVGFTCFSDGCAEHTMGDLIRMLESKTGRKSPVSFYAGMSVEDRELAEIVDYWRRMSHTVQFRDDVDFDFQTWTMLESITETDPHDYGLTVDTLRDAFFLEMIRRCETADDDAEREYLTTQASVAFHTENLQSMGALMGSTGLYIAFRNTQRWSEDRQYYRDYLRRMDHDRPLTTLELMWIVGSPSEAPLTYHNLLNIPVAELAAITTINDL